MEVISSNIANINTTRSLTGGPYQRLSVLFSEKSFSEILSEESSLIEKKLGGVAVDVVKDKSPFKTVYNPSHPDADEKGFVKMPNVNLATEMVDLTEASRMFEAQITAYNTTKKMMQDLMQLP
ncbi:flagellar basal body rod protein FlgC [candidate division WOR-1 bacterium RIFOXYC2_FULL_37_10]|uniref:Flagellar basal-body rod protein FlgC n=1 Tax=candidate division WOR-1 bacterium RIFOXYB2_FULL_37_13 TaxID=1802579 RepID=A0A1F4SL32_UNCSA|nr:MAG: flagellar basal body rod protein FlgC [candidate division WOR-1 bacterium RIFOXYB2_FULL_37_13]OGC36254.1 MAG: flagellar basal body rod protein FlgC [candidate division WOR-1 bacterium RIFOXYC2_FULL_37_10]